jgi:hypothetical protein
VRRVQPAERAFLAEYFGRSLAVDALWLGSSLGRRSWSPIGARISLTRDLYEGRDPRAAVRLDDARAAAIFAHEALHVWQRQHGRRVTWEGARLQAGYSLDLFDPYAYDERERDPATLLTHFVFGNIEQQGRMFEHYVFAARTGRDITRFARLAAWVRGA